MPKLKTHKGTKARVKITGRGKVKAMRTGKRHDNAKKSGKSIRQGRTDLVLSKTEVDRIHKLMPYDK
jgi:large subunit ribosomal protein L35